MTTVNDRQIGLPARTHKAEGLPNSSGMSSGLALPKPVHRQIALPGATATPARNDSLALPPKAVQASKGLPYVAKAPTANTVMTEPVTPKSEETSQSVQRQIALPGAASSQRKNVGLPPKASAPAMPQTRKALESEPAGLPHGSSVELVEADEVESVEAVEPAAKKSRVSQVPVPVRQTAVKNQQAPRKKRGKIRPTDRDRKWMDCIHRYGVVTTAHIAYLEGISIDSARKRLSAMKGEGWIEHDNRQIRVWRLKKDGAELIGIPRNEFTEGKFLAQMKFPHTLAVATVGIMLEKGGQDAVERLGIESILSPNPKTFITEGEMKAQAGKFEDGFIRKNWKRLNDDLLLDPVHPRLPHGSSITDAWEYVQGLGLTEEETDIAWGNIWTQENANVETLGKIWRGTYDLDNLSSTGRGYAHLGNMDDPKLVSTKPARSGNGFIETPLTHQPDGLVVMPHIVNADGTVRGGSYAIEIELHSKSNKTDYMRSITALYMDPKLAGAIWFFAATASGKAARMLFTSTLKEMSERHDALFTWEEASKFFRRGKVTLLNQELSPKGELG